MIKQKWMLGWLGFVVLLLLSGWAAGYTHAHGTDITYTVATTVEMEALFDNGEPMSACQFTVYAPNDPAVAWMTGECEEDGRFYFAPDPAISGNWAVSIRQAGHGEIVNVPAVSPNNAFGLNCSTKPPGPVTSSIRR